MDQQSAIPSPPSWVDQLIVLIERLPGPPWIMYLAITIALVFIGQGLHWLEGSEQLGVFNLARMVEAPLVIYFLEFMHYLNVTAGRSMDAYRLALAAGDAEVARLRHEITVAAVSFVLPLSGMHHLLEKEKSRLSAKWDRRFEAAFHRLHQHLDSESLQELRALNTALSSLMIDRHALAKISTWPWRPETLRGFLTTIAIPLLLWLMRGLLGRLPGFQAPCVWLT